MWFIGVEVEQETSAPPPKKNPGSAPVNPRLPTMSSHSNGTRYLSLIYQWNNKRGKGWG